jgi:hypothetical protein
MISRFRARGTHCLSINMLSQSSIAGIDQAFRATHGTQRLLRDPLRQSLPQAYSDDTIRRGLHRLVGPA